MRYSPNESAFVLVSILALVLTMPVLAQQHNNVREGYPKPFLSLAEGGLIYDTSMQYKEFNVSGLLVMKRMDVCDFHVVLLSKFGVAVMEFKLHPDKAEWIKIMDRADRKIIKSLIEQDFRVLTLAAFDNQENVKPLKNKEGISTFKAKGAIRLKAKMEKASGDVVLAKNKGGLNPFRTTVNYSDYVQNVPNLIEVGHRGVKMEMKLKLLKNQ